MARPRPLPTLVVVSAICCLLLCGLWAASWWRIEYAEYVRLDAPWRVSVGCTDGSVIWMWRRGGSGGYGSVDGFRAYTDDPVIMRRGRGGGPDLRAATIGLDVIRGSIGTSHAVFVQCPLWPAILLTAVPPAWWWIRRKRRAGARGFEVGVTDP